MLCCNYLLLIVIEYKYIYIDIFYINLYLKIYYFKNCVIIMYFIGFSCLKFENCYLWDKSLFSELVLRK